MSIDENKVFTFKLYVFKNSKEIEIRKFNLKKNELSFEKMEEILQAIFPNLSQSKFTLLWKDEMSDMITLSTSKEFSTLEEHIINSGESENIKLFINLEDELFGIAQRFEQNVMNTGITCNTCQRQFTPKCGNCSKSNIPREKKALNIIDPATGNSILTEFRKEENNDNTASTSNESNINHKTSDQHKTAFCFGAPSTFSSFSEIKKNGTTNIIEPSRLVASVPKSTSMSTNVFK